MSQDSASLIGQILVALGKINKQQLVEALEQQTKSGQDSGGEKKPLGQVLLELGYVEPNDIIGSNSYSGSNAFREAISELIDRIINISAIALN